MNITEASNATLLELYRAMVQPQRYIASMKLTSSNGDVVYLC